MKERLFAAYFTEGRLVGDRPRWPGWRLRSASTPARSATVCTVTDFTDEVRDDEARAAALGVSGVPFFVIDEAYGFRRPVRRRVARCHGTGLVGVGVAHGRVGGDSGRRHRDARRGRPDLSAGLGSGAEHPVGAAGGERGHQSALVHHGPSELVPVGVLSLGQPVHLDQFIDHRVVGGRGHGRQGPHALEHDVARRSRPWSRGARLAGHVAGSSSWPGCRSPISGPSARDRARRGCWRAGGGRRPHGDQHARRCSVTNPNASSSRDSHVTHRTWRRGGITSGRAGLRPPGPGLRSTRCRQRARPGRGPR